MFILKHSV